MHTLPHNISLYPRLIFNTKSAVFSLTVIAALFGPLSRAQALTASGPIVINGQNGTVVSGLRITSTSADCVKIINSTNITIQKSEIGPCGTNNTTSPSNGIHISGSSGIQVYDNYIHVERLASGCCDTHDGVLIDSSATNVAIQGNVIAYSETNIEAKHGSSHITVTGNFLLNPRGPFPRGQNFQSSSPSTSYMVVSHNYTLSSTDTTKYLYPENQEDSFNFSGTNTFTVENNYVVGGHSPSGCAMIVDSGSNHGQFLNNTVVNSGECGISISTGVGHVMDSNKVLNLTPVVGGGNTAMSVWKQSSTQPCGGASSPTNIQVSNNIAAEVRTDGTDSGWWDGGGCDPLLMYSNTWGQAAYNLLYPMANTNPAPLIPPQPYSCVISSPYSTQTTKPQC